MRRAITVGAGIVLAVTILAAAMSAGASPITASRSQVTSGWSSAREIDVHGLVSISCPETSFCAAVDSAGQTMTYDRLLVEAGASGGWSRRCRRVLCEPAILRRRGR